MKKLILTFLLILLMLFIFISCYKQSPEDLPDLIPHRKGDKWGFCDKNKNIVIECNYDRVGDFSEGFATVFLDGKWGYINKRGEEITPIKYNLAKKFMGGLGRVKLNEKHGHIDKDGHEFWEEVLLMHKQIPKYPKFVKKLKWQGIVMLGMEVNKEGGVINVYLLNSSGYKILDKASIKAGYQCKFKIDENTPKREKYKTYIYYYWILSPDIIIE